MGWTLSSAVSGLLFGIQPHDPVVYVLVAISGLAMLAALVLARRASSVDPIIAAMRMSRALFVRSLPLAERLVGNAEVIARASRRLVANTRRAGVMADSATLELH